MGKSGFLTALSFTGLVSLMLLPSESLLSRAAATPGDPAPANKVAEILSSLEINEGRIVGEASVVGDFNEVARRFELDNTGPRGRDFSIKMVWADHLQQALFVGANHGAPHRLNDVWSFDLDRLQWTLLYQPDNPRSYRGLGNDSSDVRYQDGILQTERGGPAVIAHTWWGLTWDSEDRRMLFMNTWVPDEVMVRMIESLDGDPSERYRGPPLWAFDPETREWEVVKTSRPWPRAPFGGMLEYVPSLGGSLWHASNWQMRSSWLYRSGDENWKKLDANDIESGFQRRAPRVEQVGYHDPVRDIVVAHRERNTYHFDVAAQRWEQVIAGNDQETNLPYGHNARSVFHFDPYSGHGLLVELRGNHLWAYNPDERQWSKLDPVGEKPPTGRKRLAYFDPRHNVLVIIKDTLVWVYRYS